MFFIEIGLGVEIRCFPIGLQQIRTTAQPVTSAKSNLTLALLPALFLSPDNFLFSRVMLLF